MSRHSLLDYLQDHRFWLADVTPQFDSLDTIPFWALSPVLGFQRCTAPALEADVKQITPGGSHQQVSVVRRINTGTVTFARGSLFYESDFARWMMRSAAGIGVPRRDLLLIQFMHMGFDLTGGGSQSGGAVGAAAGAGVLGGLGAGLSGGGAAGAIAAASVMASVLALAAINEAQGGDSIVRIPAKAWSLVGCIPTSYRGASDFDATSGQISVQELTVQPLYADEISLAG